MSQSEDFERAWLSKLAAGLARIAGESVCHQVMAGSEVLSGRSGPQDVIAWSQGAMARLDRLVDEPQRRAILCACSCQYPKAGLHEIRQLYETTHDLHLVHGMLQARFEAFLRVNLALGEELIGEIVRRGWGLAGVLEGRTIVAAKIPKSEFLTEYLRETDPVRKRQYYCHCPRVRDLLRQPETISATYCYCGAGYYQGIWEEILQQPVQVELLESVLQGGDLCRVAIRLPGGA